MAELIRMEPDGTFLYKCENCGKPAHRIRKHTKGRLLCAVCAEMRKIDYRKECRKEGAKLFLEFAKKDITDPEIIKILEKTLEDVLYEVDRRKTNVY